LPQSKKSVVRPIPCPPAEADGSPTNFVYDLKFVPDIQINQLLQQNGGIHGVDFLWDVESTLLLQRSSDLNNWTNIGYIWSNPPETRWTTNTDLGVYGHFFRLELVADGYTTNVAQLSAATVRTSRGQPEGGFGPPSIGFQFIDGQMVVTVSSQMGQLPPGELVVQAMDPMGAVVQTQQAFAQGNSVKFNFNRAISSTPENQSNFLK
jgi:hypothetical protein